MLRDPRVSRHLPRVGKEVRPISEHLPRAVRDNAARDTTAGSGARLIRASDKVPSGHVPGHVPGDCSGPDVLYEGLTPVAWEQESSSAIQGR